MRPLLLLLLLLLLSGCALDAGLECDATLCPGECRFEPDETGWNCSDDGTDGLPPCTSVWSGSYTCGQGLTALDLSISHHPATHELTALFHFSEHGQNPGVPSGCFTMRGDYESESGRVTLYQETWIDRPVLYVMVDLDGSVDGDVLEGSVLGPGCSDFTLERQ
jgi:hypothetical protein